MFNKGAIAGYRKLNGKAVTVGAVVNPFGGGGRILAQANQLMTANVAALMPIAAKKSFLSITYIFKIVL